MAKVLVDRKRNRVLAVADVKGYFDIRGYGRVRNKFTRNIGYIVDGLLRRADVTVYDTGGTGRTAKTSFGGINCSLNTSIDQGVQFFIPFGTGTTTPTITDNNLVSLSDWLNVSVFDIVEETNQTSLVIAGRWAPTISRTLYEVGLFWESDSGNHYRTLLARTVISEGISKSPFTIYLDGYRLTFPATFTKWFVRALFSCMMGLRCVRWMSLPVRDSTGVWFSTQSADTFAGSPDVMIGSDNSSASPDQYSLVSPIASLSSQSQAVEVDTANQEVRVVRQGTYTPSANVTLGEVGLFTNLNVYADTSLVSKKVMVARVPLDTPITLSAGVTYTIGIVLRFA
jgi:hypothetical protein